MTIQMLEENGIYRHPDHIKAEQLDDGSETLLEMLQNATKRRRECDFLGTIQDQKLVYESYETIWKKITNMGSFLRQKNNEARPIGIFSVNRAEWLISEFAIYINNSPNCPLYSTFGIESLMHVINETEMRICFVSNAKAGALCDIIMKETFHLKTVICFDQLEQQHKDIFDEKDIEVIYFQDIVNEDCEFDTELPYDDLPSKNDIATICYTSGTSGMPKGVMLTHLNFMATVIGFVDAKNEAYKFKINPTDVYISYLPLAHVMERACVLILIANGAKIGFFRGNPRLLQQDMEIIKPTFLAAVPRVFNAFADKIQEELSKKSYFVQWLVKAAVKYKIYRQKSGVYSSYILDSLIFNKVKNKFGGRIRASLNGSAPLSANVTEYLQAFLSFRIFQGYGQTEATAANILQEITDTKNDNVGIPFPSNLIKLNPTTDYPGRTRGEIYLKGKNVTKGYFKRPDMTKELFDDGWLKTGDIGSIEDGVFRIIGRKKEIFKTSHGEYIVPEKIEGILKGGVIKDILVTGRSYGDYIVALVVCPLSISPGEVYKKMCETGDKAVKQGKLARIEIPRKIHVLKEDFDAYGEFSTPTMKKRRNKIECHFEKEIDSLYVKR